MEWIILLFIVLFIIGRMQRNSPGHPANAFAGMTTNTPVITGATSGDSFCGTTQTIASGIPQPPSLPPHSVFPVPVVPGVPAPPPIAIQKPGISPRSTTGTTAPKPLGGGAGINTRVYGMPHYRGY